MSDGHVIHEPGGSIAIPAGTLQKIVQRAAESVDGARVRRRHRPEVHVEGDTARVDLSLAAPYGAVLPELAREVQEHVTSALAAMCGLTAAVDVAVEELDAR